MKKLLLATAMMFAAGTLAANEIEITVTSLDSNNAVESVPIMIDPYQLNSCSHEAVVRFFSREPVNENHLQIMCKMMESANRTDYFAPDYVAPVYVLVTPVEPFISMLKGTKSTWGRPDTIRVYENSYNSTEYWHYEDGRMLVFENDNLTSIVYDK